MSTIDIQIVSTPNLQKIENYLNHSSYRESIEYSANFNTRLCLERRLRVPFFDPQTGVAQNHSSLFMDRRQRMPGSREGQVYTYPAARWRKSHRQYLSKMWKPFSSIPARRPDQPNIGSTSTTTTTGQLIATVVPAATITTEPDTELNGTVLPPSFLEESSSLGGADTSDSKDSQNIKEELPKEWFYDDIDINDMDGIDEPKSPADDEYDYDPRYGNKKRKKRKPGRKPQTPHLGDGPRKGRPPGGGTGVGRGRGRRKATGTRSVIEPPSPPAAEPPSFETAAAAVEHAHDDSNSTDLRSYRKYL